MALCVDATVTLEAWRFGDDLRQKPLNTITAAGTDGRTMDNAIFIAWRGLEEVEWWSVYKLEKRCSLAMNLNARRCCDRMPISLAHAHLADGMHASAWRR